MIFKLFSSYLGFSSHFFSIARNLEHSFFAKFDSIARDSLVGLQIEHAGESFVIVVVISAHTNAFGTIDPLRFTVDFFLTDCIIVVMNKLSRIIRKMVAIFPYFKLCSSNI